MRALCLILLLCLSQVAGAAGNPAAAFRAITPGPARPVSGSFQTGHASFQLEGRLAPLLVDGKPVGAFFEGRGVLRYQSVLEAEFPVLTRNLADMPRVASQPSKGLVQVEIPFTAARFLSAGTPLPSGAGEASAAPVEAHEAHQHKLRLIQDYDPAHLLALQALNGGTRPLLLAELRSEDKYWLYRYDGALSQEEELAWLQPEQGHLSYTREWFHMVRMSRQPIGWNLKLGPAPLDFTIRGLDVDLRTEDNRQAEFVVKQTLALEQDGIRALEFGLLTEIVTEEDVRRLKVLGIQDASGAELAFDQAKDRLLVDLGRPGSKGQPVQLTFRYQGDILIRPGKDTYWQLGVRGLWYPSALTLHGENFLFHGTVRTAGDWIAFLPGDTLRRVKEGTWNLVETRTEKPICFATILGGRYHLEDEVRDGLTIRVATYAFKAGAGKKPILDQAFNVVRYYQTFLGPFPFKEFLIIEKNQWGYGQAPPGMMYITKEAFNQHMDWAQYFRLGIRKRYAHEIAHQYWGTVVKMPSPEDQWITEAFADYCAALYERDFKGQGQFDKSVAEWKANAKEAAGKAPIPFANDLRLKDGLEGFRTRTFLLYDKGPMILLALHQEMGDLAFMSFLKSLQANFRWRFLSTHLVADFLKFMTKKDWDPFFDKYYWGLEIPPTK